MTTAAGCDGRVAAHPPPALAALASAGVLAAGDVQIASRLCALAGEDRDDVLRAAALAARAPRLGHVCVDLADVGAMVVAEAATAGADVPALPHPSAWRDALAASPLVAVGNADDGPRRALRLDGNLLYLDRYWRDERELAAALRARSHPAPGVDFDLLGRGLTVLWREDLDDQREAAALGVMRRLTVIGGGPGTGKTTTIARMLALLDAQLGGVSPRTVALAAPTGKAAQRMQEAVHDAAREMPVAPAVRGRLMALEGRTVHRLLRSRWGSQTRFRHDAGNPLPHDVVIVDEASMMSLPLMARLVDALRADARLVLVGDPDQLASVEAGSVLGDIMGPARERPVRSAATLLALRAAGAVDADRGEAGEPADASTTADGVAILRRVYRFGGGIAGLADAIRRGDADAAIAVLAAGRTDVLWIDADAADVPVGDLGAVRDPAVAWGAALAAHGRAGEATAALARLDGFRLLCAHRRGPYGARHWGELVERWASPAGTAPGMWLPGTPVMITRNDHALRLFNGDTGVTVRRGDVREVAFPRGDGLVGVRPGRLADAEPVYAMTAHKSQGSQFGTVAVIVPPVESRIASRELLYTAVTRARERVIVVGAADQVRAAIARPIVRASGLRRRLWGDDAGVDEARVWPGADDGRPPRWNDRRC